MAKTSPEENFAALGLVLPPAPKPLGVYKPGLQVDHFYYVSGHGTVQTDGSLIIGRIGADLDIEEGKLAARQVGLAILATLKAQLGSLNRIKRVIKVLGAQVWGEENGIGVRSAVGMGTLPDNIPVEIEAVFELND